MAPTPFEKSLQSMVLVISGSEVSGKKNCWLNSYFKLFVLAFNLYTTITTTTKQTNK